MQEREPRGLWRGLYAELLWRLERCERVLVRIERRLVTCERLISKLMRSGGTTTHSVEMLGTLAFAAFVMASISLFVAIFK